MDKLWMDDAWKDLERWIDEDRKVLRKILVLMRDIERNANSGYGKPEPLRGDLSGYWSRRITEKDRLVYKIEKDQIVIVQCGSHYGDR